MKKILLIFTLLLSITSLKGQSRLSAADISFLYNQNHEFLVDHRVAQKGNEVKVFLRFILNSTMVKISDYEIFYDLRSSYIDERHINGLHKLDSTTLAGTGFREFVYAFSFQKQEDQNLIAIEINNVARGKKFFVDIPLKSNGDILNQPFLLFEENRNVPFFSSFINVNQKIRLINVFGDDGRYEIKGLQNNKAVAIPPFFEGDVDEPSDISIDTLYGAVEGKPFQLSASGYYLINDATAPENQMGILVTDEFHPYFGAYDMLIQPLIFISTNDEFKNLRQAEDARNAFEDFVMNRISANGKVAQDFVKYYYRRIRKSAYFFSTYKEGWKTDRGMVFQVFGNPLQVFRNENTELWVYASPNGGRTRFIFDIVPGKGNILEYKLIRGERYKDAWMEAVSDWRSGKIIEE